MSEDWGNFPTHRRIVEKKLNDDHAHQGLGLRHYIDQDRRPLDEDFIVPMLEFKKIEDSWENPSRHQPTPGCETCWLGKGKFVSETQHTGKRGHDFKPLTRSVGDRFSAAKSKPKPKKPRTPEEVWYDVHKHPEGVAGGMGKSPEHHLRNRGWRGHEINGAGSKTIQYRHADYPDFVISYGGGTSTKPNHNFRVLYMGTNKNIPKVTRAFSVAEAMNKTEELHSMNNGLVVQPMTHAATAPNVQTTKQLQMALTPGRPKKPRDMTDHELYPIGPPDPDDPFPTKPAVETDWYKPQVNEIHPIKDSKPKHKTSAILETSQKDSWEE